MSESSSPEESPSLWTSPGARAERSVDRVDKRVCTAFWILGLINNVLYVVILSAALDLVGPAIPKGIVLLADEVPATCLKLIAPYFMHLVPYRIRILILVALSTAGMLLVAFTSDIKDSGGIAAKMAGVVLASTGCGGGELTFLGLTHYYGHWSLASWSSGTGAAGLVGAGLYLAATTWFGWTIKGTLFASAILPQIMTVSFFLILPLDRLDDDKGHAGTKYEDLSSDEPADDLSEPDDDEQVPTSASPLTQPDDFAEAPKSTWGGFEANLRRARHLIVPYMLPLFIVYAAEYLINQGVAPTLLFPLSVSPFGHFREFYPTYNWIYQAGVFLSRSSTPLIRIHALYPPSILQCLNLVLATAISVWMPSSAAMLWVTFGLIFWEGLLGGVVYVNTFAEIADRVPAREREFSLAATSVSDALGICLAGFLGLGLETSLCAWQVRRGRDFCRRL